MKERGITLIALIVTIIVLLILAAVSIATLTGENGILTRANDAKENTEQAEEDELRKLTALEAATNLEDTIYTDNSTGEEKIVTIPAETAVSQVEGENTLKDGLVIIDKNGNEWVWIEVPKNEVFLTANNSKDYDNIKNDLITYASIYREGTEGEGRYWTDEYYNGCGIQDKNTYDKMYNNMLSSIYQNGGFWIGRYETGFSENTPRNKDDDVTEVAKIQKNLYPYNFVTCSQAQTLASNISPNNNKTSSLLFGIQWDLICKFLEKNANLSIDEIKSDSTNWGNYSNSTFQIENGKYAIYNQSTETLKNWNISQNYLKSNSGTDNMVLLSTGASNYTKKMNIYDLAGNMWEWTLEYTGNYDKASSRRGSGYRNPGYTHPASNRGAGTISENFDSIGFRIALY